MNNHDHTLLGVQLRKSQYYIVWGITFILCVGSRLLTTIYYIEDLDSLRFALSMVDYDVAKFQPHFPAYPVFCFVAKLIYAAMGSYALTFSFIGGVSTFLTIYFLCKLARLRSTSSAGLFAIVLLIVNPLLWLMGNRYMPDAMGVACLLASLYFTTANPERPRRVGLGFFLAGILGGIRLSYLPMLIPALLMSLPRRTVRYTTAGIAGFTVWLLPLTMLTGWDTLVESAQVQSRGHFLEFGGTIANEPQLWLRVTKLVESLWADGFGLYWNDRNIVTACTTVALGGILAANWRRIQRIKRSDVLNACFIGCIVYLIWIFCFQNVVHKSRHVLPLVPFLALFLAFACARIIEHRNRTLKAFLIAFVLCYGYVAIHLVVQHKKPTAIAQIHHNLSTKQSDRLRVASVPLIAYYLASQGLQAVYIPLQDPSDLAALDEKSDGSSDLVAIGSPIDGRIPKAEKTFYHNPYVNRMWPSLSLYEY